MPCELQHCQGGKYNHWAKVQAFFNIQLHVTTSIFPHNKLIDCLALWNEFKVNNTLDIKESNEHCLHL
jgi:adenosyl cobinamide kinase/adenosyl cobinamide phosphate guanylyltransferase